MLTMLWAYRFVPLISSSKGLRSWPWQMTVEAYGVATAFPYLTAARRILSRVTALNFPRSMVFQKACADIKERLEFLPREFRCLLLKFSTGQLLRMIVTIHPVMVKKVIAAAKAST